MLQEEGRHFMLAFSWYLSFIIIISIKVYFVNFPRSLKSFNSVCGIISWPTGVSHFLFLLLLESWQLLNNKTSCKQTCEPSRRLVDSSTSQTLTLGLGKAVTAHCSSTSNVSPEGVQLCSSRTSGASVTWEILGHNS